MKFPASPDNVCEVQLLFVNKSVPTSSRPFYESGNIK